MMKSRNSLNVILIYGVIFILSCLTFFSDTYLNAYNINSDNLINFSTVETNLSIDDIKIDQGYLSISSRNPINYSHYSYITIVDESKDFINLTTHIKSKDIKHGEKFWETARISLHFFDLNKNVIPNLNNTAKYVYKDTSWSLINHTYRIPDFAIHAKTSLEFLNATGTLTVKNIEIFYAEESIIYKSARYTLLILWFFLLLIIAKKLSTAIKKIYLKIIFLLIFSFIVIGVTLPQDFKLILINTLSNSYVNFYHDNIEYILFNYLSSPMKAAHFIAFTLISYIAFITFTKLHKISTIIINLIVFSLITEIIQLLVLERTPQLNDIIIDCAGVFTGLIFFYLHRKVFVRQHKTA
ncbi:hypothetical protein MNBD_GAMMA05-635 [hydrothermal vent metagenome]|uniref:VanZ-like domain-containing protein n=1 Tax=hydrothermal vent metagenome TaxID=652676 RepID=A0A3B0WIG6_9ZZZZ